LCSPAAAARAAYQVGVLKAVRDILGGPVKNPFPILCGTSAGAINAAALAVFADDFTRAVGNLLEVWEHMRCDLIYGPTSRASPAGACDGLPRYRGSARTRSRCSIMRR
jgi:NTE family protein